MDKEDKERKRGGKGEEWEVGSVKHAHKVPPPLLSLRAIAPHMEPLSRFLKERSAVEAPPIQASARVKPLRPTDTQHMCSLARALGEAGEGSGEQRQRSRRVHGHWPGGGGGVWMESRVNKRINMKRQAAWRSEMTTSDDSKTTVRKVITGRPRVAE